MMKTLGSAALQLYAGVAAMFLPIENQPGLIADLESDLFLGHALSSATCELYHRYGMFFAPLTAALTTLKHCQFGHCCPVSLLMEQTKLENQETAEEPTQSPPVEKVKDKKKWQPGVPALPPERQSKKNDFSSSFEQPRNLLAPPPPPTPPPPRLPIFLLRSRTKRFPRLGPMGHWSLSCGRGARVSPTNEESRDRPRWLRAQAASPRC